MFLNPNKIIKEAKMELKEKLGERIKELRLKHNLKQSELAEMVDIATKTQSCIERGKNYPSSDLIERYAKAFNIDVEELFLLNHLKTKQELLNKISNILENASEEEIILVYKILNGIFN